MSIFRLQSGIAPLHPWIFPWRLLQDEQPTWLRLDRKISPQPELTTHYSCSYAYNISKFHSAVMPVRCEKKYRKAAARPLWAAGTAGGRLCEGGIPKIFVNFTANSCNFLIPERNFKHMTKLIWFGLIQVRSTGSSCFFHSSSCMWW